MVSLANFCETQTKTQVSTATQDQNLGFQDSNIK